MDIFMSNVYSRSVYVQWECGTQYFCTQETFNQVAKLLGLTEWAAK